VGVEKGQGMGREGWREAVGVEDLDDSCPEKGVEESVVRDEIIDDATASKTETDGEGVGTINVGGEHGDTERDERRDVHRKQVMFPRNSLFFHPHPHSLVPCLSFPHAPGSGLSKAPGSSKLSFPTATTLQPFVSHSTS